MQIPEESVKLKMDKQKLSHLKKKKSNLNNKEKKIENKNGIKSKGLGDSNKSSVIWVTGVPEGEDYEYGALKT